jgi:transposase
MSPKRVKKLL